MWTGIALAGAVMGFKASGGNLNDLKDMNKMKSSFGGAKNDGEHRRPRRHPRRRRPPPVV